MPTPHTAGAYLKLLAFRRDAAADRDERARILKEPYTDAARLQKLAPVEQKLRTQFAATRDALVLFVKEAEQRHLEQLPPAVARAAAMVKPERAVAIRELARTASPDDLVAFARQAETSNDPAAAFGLRQVLAQRTEQLSFDVRTKVTDALNRIGSDSATDALADLIGARTIRDRLDAGGPYLGDASTATLADPLKALQRVNALAMVPIGGGEMRQLSEADVRQLQQLADVFEDVA
ncbi:MAG TPA: hypothetical protein VGM82_00980 [Gemmatimonadaceae bacterium]|jgi:hypothetical protein